ncbi:amino acid ABC transporter ATP-binding protein [Neorhizobium galegae]|uniref:amino acid ABC transporter ATP-binding protein n=1 Tax=Neorhizobium galegae TaxID=399 RepID=UPI0006210AD8|nr:amino acid ABC transporter ATP-binding protein [Neorhizobium galegae]CDZ64074.1 YckI (ABC transporter YckI) [Neorhizobium galegae bv. orientalis]KAB1120236.1 amino acid ABC transporter ATP-binding protein [Neorhizobium galegae]MCQ1570398.1 amino acid ABC transporter ATP-binding protein [Neorhizobium galegae]MCQ1810216.1 amino acid ABC transporter ATP-binding protein [Neorhizobium galegae]MCQ1839005.1 amino acid ABC transporter ATP-binding protein [Neorhizobium galegae]
MIELSNIEKRFGDAVILKDIRLGIPEGSVTALIGPSGGGKSTLLRCINLLEIPTAGSVRIGDEKLDFEPGMKIGWKSIQKIRRQTGMVFQNFQLFPHRTAIENVMEGLTTVLRWPREKAHNRASELLTKVGMAHKTDAWPSELSGGQQQRVAIARALAPSPRVLLCDEPTSALDPELSAEVIDVLGRLAAEGTTMVMATHDLRLASRVANHVVFLESGKVVESGRAQAIFGDPKQERTKSFISSINAAQTTHI